MGLRERAGHNRPGIRPQAHEHIPRYGVHQDDVPDGDQGGQEQNVIPGRGGGGAQDVGGDLKLEAHDHRFAKAYAQRGHVKRIVVQEADQVLYKRARDFEYDHDGAAGLHDRNNVASRDVQYLFHLALIFLPLGLCVRTLLAWS